MFINQKEAKQLTKEILHLLQVYGINLEGLTEDQAQEIAIAIWRRGGEEWNGKDWIITHTELWEQGKRVA